MPVTVIGILASLLLPALQAARHQAQLAVCRSNLRQIAVGSYTYTVDSDSYFPSLGNDLVDSLGNPVIGRNNSYNLEYHANDGIEPLLDTVFDGRTQRLFTCPLGRQGYTKNKWDTYTSYSYWPDVNGRGAIGTDRSLMLMKTGDDYRLNTSSTPRYWRSRIMAHDMCRVVVTSTGQGGWPGNRRIATNHFTHNATKYDGTAS